MESLVFVQILERGNLLRGIDNKTVKRQEISICLLMFSSQ